MLLVLIDPLLTNFLTVILRHQIKYKLIEDQNMFVHYYHLECLLLQSLPETQSYITWCQKWLAMATLTLQPPVPFNFAKSDEWPKWIKRFEQYHVASGFSKDTDTRQVSTLLYCLGEEAKNVLSSNNFSAKGKTNTAKS